MRLSATTRLAILTVLTIAVWWWRSQLLTVQRIIVANLPADINRLVVTDLDQDGESELVVYHAPSAFKTIPMTFSLPLIRETSTFYIRNPLTKPRLEKLPYNFGILLPAFLPPLKKLLVEKVNEPQKPNEIGWLTICSGNFVFEPLFPRLGRVRCHLAVAGNIVNISVNLESRFADIPPKHLSFCITPDGDWQTVKFEGWKGGRVYWYGMEYFGDFDGDGIVDLLKFSSAWSKPSRVEVYWGDGKKATTLLEGRAFSSKTIVDDLDNDGTWEIVTLGRIWKFLRDRKHFVPIAKFPLKTPHLSNQNLPKPTQGRKIVPTPSSPPTMIAGLPYPPPPFVLDKIATADLDSDGQKELMVFWREPILTDIPPFPIPQLVATQVLWREGQIWKVNEFKPPEMRVSSEPSAIFEIKGQRYAVAGETYQRIRLRFPIVSLRPLRLKLWERVTESKICLFRLPEGRKAFDLRQWKKIAELPLAPILVGDWDEDGRVEMLMRKKFWGNNHSYYGEPKPASETLYLACFDGRKVRLAKLPPPKFMSLSSQISSIAIIKGQKDAAIFVLWDRSYEKVLERVRWW